MRDGGGRRTEGEGGREEEKGDEERQKGRGCRKIGMRTYFANLSEVRCLWGIVSPTPMSFTRCPQKNWSPKKGTITVGFPYRSPAAVVPKQDKINQMKYKINMKYKRIKK